MTTLSQSFWQTLPVLQIVEPARPREVPQPGSSTLAVDPPIALEPCEPLVFFQEGNCLRSVGAGLDNHLPAVESFFYLRLEADVVHASRLYLLHPINMALQGLTDTPIACQAEESQGSTARTDISWKYYDEQNEEWKMLAILEFKNTFLLIEREFTRAMADMEPGASRSPKALVDRAYQTNQRHFTWLGEGAGRLTRQALKYSGSAATDYVAIFDWKSMVILDFEGIDEGAYKLAKGTWFEEVPTQPPTHETFRMLLFGMLVKALRRNGLVG
ncbi:MAG: hypothetical protein M1830_010382 [Pleopsidium flavum]|nr:MAG: hypothetical protein M1830_010382 [Pleopsidium flavum]